MGQKNDKRLVELYFAGTEMLEEGMPSVLNRPRSEAITSFNLLGLPPKGTGNGDQYHYTDLYTPFTADLEHYFTPSYLDVSVESDLSVEGYRISLINGFSSEQDSFSQLENGIIYGSLATVAKERPELLEPYYNAITDNANDALSALNTAFMQDGAFVYVPRNVQAEAPFIIEYSQYAEHESLLLFGRNLIVLEEGAQARIILSGRTFSEERFVSCYVSELFAGERSHLEMTELHRLNDHSVHIHSIYAKQATESTLGTLSVALSGAQARTNQRVQLEGSHAENHTYGLYIASGEEHYDYMTNIEHLAPDCTSYEHFKGIAASEGTGVFNGRIYVAPDAQQTQAFQQNNNLVLGDDAHIYTKPQLEIYANNVKCSHGATVGQFDEDAVYYMRQRGIGEQDARRLQMFGFIHEIIGKCSVDGICSMIDELATSKIENL